MRCAELVLSASEMFHMPVLRSCLLSRNVRDRQGEAKSELAGGMPEFSVLLQTTLESATLVPRRLQ